MSRGRLAAAAKKEKTGGGRILSKMEGLYRRSLMCASHARSVPGLSAYILIVHRCKRMEDFKLLQDYYKLRSA